MSTDVTTSARHVSEQEARQVAEAARETEWTRPSFAKELYLGRFDLSLESTVGLAPALAVALVIPAASNGLGTDWPTTLAIPICLLIGLAIGAFNGLLILRFGLSAFIVTLGMLIVLPLLSPGIVADGFNVRGDRGRRIKLIAVVRNDAIHSRERSH